MKIKNAKNVLIDSMTLQGALIVKNNNDAATLCKLFDITNPNTKSTGIIFINAKFE